MKTETGVTVHLAGRGSSATRVRIVNKQKKQRQNVKTVCGFSGLFLRGSLFPHEPSQSQFVHFFSVYSGSSTEGWLNRLLTIASY